MHQLNNLDVVLLILTLISAVIAVYRGFIKEVLSIIGWILAAAVVFYLLPIFTPLAKHYIASPMMAGVVAALTILIVFYIVWILCTDRLIGKIRKSKLSTADRILGLVFGVLRAFLLVVLFNILISWTLPEESKSGIFKESGYFTLAGEYAEPLEKLIPQSTMDMIRKQTSKVGLGEEQPKAEKKDSEKDEKSSSQKEGDQTSDSKKKKAASPQGTPEQQEIDQLFEKLAQPKIEKIGKEKLDDQAKNFDGYQKNEADNLDRLIENTTD
jgi:membrane protein required for colicin V production